MMEICIHTEDTLSEAATTLLNYAGTEKIFLFEGEMAAGKTTFIKSICNQLGSVDPVSSPTYSIVNEYDSPVGKIYHFDFFRINNELEALDIGFEEYLSSGYYCFIEWPEKIRGLWPIHYTKVSVNSEESGKRTINIHQV